jgi:hypothetical protein
MTIAPTLTNCTYDPITDTIKLNGPSSFISAISSFALQVLDSWVLQFYLNLTYGIAVYNSTIYILVGADDSNGYTIKICYGFLCTAPDYI